MLTEAANVPLSNIHRTRMHETCLQFKSFVLNTNPYEGIPASQ